MFYIEAEQAAVYSLLLRATRLKPVARLKETIWDTQQQLCNAGYPGLHLPWGSACHWATSLSLVEDNRLTVLISTFLYPSQRIWRLVDPLESLPLSVNPTLLSTSTGWEQRHQAQHRKTSIVCYRNQGGLRVTASSPVGKVGFQGNCSIRALKIELWWDQKIYSIIIFEGYSTQFSLHSNTLCFL